MLSRRIIQISLIIVLISIVMQYTPPAYAQFGIIGSFATCVGGNLLGNLISAGVNALQNLVTTGLSLIPGIGQFFTGTNGNSVPTDDLKNNAKSLIKNVTERCAALEIKNAISKGVLNIVRTSGRNGGPAFVRNWRNFQTDAQYRGENVFRSILASTNLCPSISQDVKNIFGASATPPLAGQNLRVNDLDPFSLRASCTMPAGFSMQKYQQDFAGNGGWDAFARLSQPQNNLYGATLLSFNELNNQRQVEQSGDIYQTLGHGYTGRTGNDPNSSCQIRGANGQCVVYNNINTPGSYIAESALQISNADINWVVGSHELNDLIAVGIQVLINRISDLSNANEGNYQAVNTNGDVSPATPPIPPQAPTAPTVNISSSAISIAAGESVTISWSSTNATGCSAAGDWSGNKPATGAESVAPTSDATYVLICTGTGGAVTGSVSITVAPGTIPPIDVPSPIP